MANKISMNRIYDEAMEELLNVSTDLHFFYKDDDASRQILNETEDYEFKTLLSNDDDSWDYVEKGLGISGNVMLGSPSSLFGPTQIVNADAELGIALQWVSKQSSQRGVIPLTTITSTTPDNILIPIDYYFQKDKLFGEVHISLVIYLKKASRNSMRGQAKLSGTILGKLVEWVVILDGSGSTFPIVIVNEPDKPLWYVDFNFSEPLVEPFDKEYIAIYLNKAHAAFPSIQKPKTKIDQALYVEFLSGALQLILQNLMESVDWQEIQNGENCEEGSIGQVMHYFITTLNWEFDTPEKLAISIRKDLETRVKTGEM
ncbi:hypothetical protein DFO73_101584 [Cytobacillus oceanisediminis]|uniref:Uncharacterized protein n=1 Tax=Cytobacillus oceanisediminis TaxID=665099 RepID=A0A2V3A8C0_9BACI|nr:hypothetical protein [Cytobacillus oceanisediminis]PWW32320.1 hypothetical protein DFO73_101584 [Cytobacillus oceanisediminis]